MAGRRPAYQRKRQNRMGMLLVGAVVLLITIVIGIRSTELRKRADAYAERIDELNGLIEQEQERTGEIEEFRKYTRTRKYAEEVAKDKLGMVYEGEIIFKEE